MPPFTGRLRHHKRMTREEVQQMHDFASEVFSSAREASYDETQVLCKCIFSLAAEARRLEGWERRKLAG